MNRYYTWTEDFNGRMAHMTAVLRADEGTVADVLLVQAVVPEDDWSPVFCHKLIAPTADDIIEARDAAVTCLRIEHRLKFFPERSS